jgi:hypothetical protein
MFVLVVRLARYCADACAAKLTRKAARLPVLYSCFSQESIAGVKRERKRFRARPDLRRALPQANQTVVW